MSKESNEGQVMDKGFSPARRGRKPLVDVEPMCVEARAAQPQWVMWEMPYRAEANSVLRQVAKIPGYEVASETNAEGGKSVYIRFKPGRTL